MLRDLRNTNQCIVAALASASSAIDALDKLLCENRSRIATLVQVARGGGFLSRSTPEEETEQSSAPDSKEIDSEKEVMAEELLQAKEEKVEIAKFLDELNEKVRKVEQAKEQ